MGADGKSVDLVGSEKMHFDYDSVIGPDGKQEDVYLASAKPVVDDFLEVSCHPCPGSACVFACTCAVL